MWNKNLFKHLDECRTTNDGPYSNAKCIFPFKYHGKTYDGCAWSCDNGGYYWCSTKVDDNDEHVYGSEGKCASGCDIHSGNSGYKFCS